MTEQEILAVMEKGFADAEIKLGANLDAQLAEFNETAKKILVKPEDIKTSEEVKAEAAKAEEAAKLEQAGAISGITSFEVWDIPLGKIAVGTFGGVFTSELIDGFLATQSNMIKGGIKLVLAGATVKWGSRWLGKDAAGAIAFALGILGMAQILPIDVYAKKAATAIRGVLPEAGSFHIDEGNPGGNGHKSAADPMQILRGA